MVRRAEASGAPYKKKNGDQRTASKLVDSKVLTFLPYVPQVQAAVDKLVEESALYVVDDGPRARLYRLT